MLMGRKTNRRHFWGWLIAGALVFCLAVLAFFPTRYFIEYPGGADRVSKFVQVDGKRDQAAGSYRLMTVSVAGPASPLLLLWGKTQPFGDIVSEQDLMGDSTSSEYNTIQNYYIRSAGNAAVASAFRLPRRSRKTIRAGAKTKRRRFRSLKQKPLREKSKLIQRKPQ